MPSKAQCNFAGDRLKWCARTDIDRGIAADDRRNIKWAELLSHLPGYRSVLRKQQDPSSVISMGDAMEMAVGLSYACHTNFEHLPKGHRVEFSNEMQERAIMLWSSMRPLFQKLGLKATERMRSLFDGRSATEHPIGQGPPAPRHLAPRVVLQNKSNGHQHRSSLKQQLVHKRVHHGLTEAFHRAAQRRPSSRSKC